jgi:hypothetical protein
MLSWSRVLFVLCLLVSLAFAQAEAPVLFGGVSRQTGSFPKASKPDRGEKIDSNLFYRSPKNCSTSARSVVLRYGGRLSMNTRP